MSDDKSSGPPLTFLAGGGEMGARMRELDWSGTSLGPLGAWPQSLRHGQHAIAIQGANHRVLGR